MNNVIGVFPNREVANTTFLSLMRAGYVSQDISIILKEDLILGKDSGQKGGYASTSFAIGDFSEGCSGGIAGILIGLSAVLVPGLGAVLIAGPFASMLGSGGVAAVTISGVVTGVLSGGLAAGLIEIGIDKESAKFYEKKVKNGGILMCVPVSVKNNSYVRKIYLDNRGSHVQEIENKSQNLN